MEASEQNLSTPSAFEDGGVPFIPDPSEQPVAAESEATDPLLQQILKDAAGGNTNTGAGA